MSQSRLKCIELEGSFYERGSIIGSTLKKDIKKLLKLTSLLIFEYYHKDPEEIIDLFFKKTRILEAVKEFTPNLYEEVYGISEGSGLDFNSIFAAQCVDELVWFKSKLNLRNERCTALGIFANGTNNSILAQNVDHLNIYKDLNVILHQNQVDLFPETYIYSLCGLIALTGLNAKALGVCTNGLALELKYSLNGLPVAYVVRGLLQHVTLSDAIDFIRKIRHASGQNYMIGDSHKVLSFECSGNKVAEYKLHEVPTIICHTNHPLINDDLIDSSLKVSDFTGANTSITRFNSVREKLIYIAKSANIKDVKKILSSHEGPICSHQKKEPEASNTLASVIYLLSRYPEFHFANGPPCINEYKKFEFGTFKK